MDTGIEGVVRKTYTIYYPFSILVLKGKTLDNWRKILYCCAYGVCHVEFN